MRQLGLHHYRMPSEILTIITSISVFAVTLLLRLRCIPAWTKGVWSALNYDQLFSQE